MRFLLLQARDAADPMRLHEVGAFGRALGVATESIATLDLLAEEIAAERIAAADILLIGGSGGYSACGDEPWLLRTLDGLRRVHRSGRPLFASCWGFQALARALGGRVIHDPGRMELGTRPLRLTAAGWADPVFGGLPETFLAPMGHEDHVVQLPPGAVLLAESERVEHQAYTFADRPIYATQFHTELTADDMRLRVRAYPSYLQAATGMTYEQFSAGLCETPDSAALLPRFVRLVAEGKLP